jgi:hypothetical protein
LRHTHAPTGSGNANLVGRLAGRLALCIALLTFVGVARAGTLYADRSDDELTQIAAGWEQLSQDERRALLSEVRARMAQTRTSSTPMVRIRTERRYGRIIRQPDGSVLRIERREGTVEYRPMPEDAAGRPFGIGFEHRLGAPAENGSEPPSVSTQASPTLPVEVSPAG